MKSQWVKYLKFGDRIRIDASTMCQLNCPVCAAWRSRERLGNGYLKFHDFKNFVDRYPNFKYIELSNKGEIFLNPELDPIIKYAHENKIHLTADNGVNLNDVSERTIEHLARYSFESMYVSIDGANDGTYKIYRKNGNFTNVIENIKKINHYKKKYNVQRPFLTWQFIVFGHNEHEIPDARNMAKELNMGFSPVFNFAPSYSPIQNKEFVRSQMELGSLQEVEKNCIAYNPENILEVCEQIWRSPQINWDGSLLGCCANLDPFPVNVFKSGLENALAHPKYNSTKKILSGKIKAGQDSQCFECSFYRYRYTQKVFLNPAFFFLKNPKESIKVLLPEKFANLLRRIIKTAKIRKTLITKKGVKYEK